MAMIPGFYPDIFTEQRSKTVAVTPAVCILELSAFRPAMDDGWDTHLWMVWNVENHLGLPSSASSTGETSKTCRFNEKIVRPKMDEFRTPPSQKNCTMVSRCCFPQVPGFLWKSQNDLEWSKIYQNTAKWSRVIQKYMIFSLRVTLLFPDTHIDPHPKNERHLGIITYGMAE